MKKFFFTSICFMCFVTPVYSQLPDLIVENITASNYDPYITDNITVYITIRNQSNYDVTNMFWVDLYHNHEPYPGEDGDDSETVYGLDANTSTTVEISWVYNYSWSGEVWQMWAQVDTWNEVEESNEDNNIFQCPEEVRWHVSEILDYYGWPIQPQYSSHDINTTFDEYHGTYFHDAIDIHAPLYTEVYSVSSGIVTRFTNGLRVGKYAYVHVDIDDNVPSSGQWIVDKEILLGQTDGENHVHFMDGYNQEEVNPLRDDGLWPPYVDGYNPTIRELVIKRSDGVILDHDKVNGEVDFIVEVKDQQWYGISRIGVYWLGYQVENSSGQIIKDVSSFQFDYWLADNYFPLVYNGESGSEYYWYIPTNEMTGGGYMIEDRSWDTKPLVPGSYLIRIIAKDKAGNETIAEFPIEVDESALQE